MSRAEIATTVTLAASLLGGCGAVDRLVTKYGRHDGASFALDMNDYEVESLAFGIDDPPERLCPGDTLPLSVVVRARPKAGGAPVELRSRDEDATPEQSRGKVDLAELAIGARGGALQSGHFVADRDPFAALLGYDLAVKYRRDPTKTVAAHFDPTYACIGTIGGSGERGASGRDGSPGADGGGMGGQGGNAYGGGPGPQLTAYVSLVRTPLYDRVGIVRVTGDRTGTTLFDPDVGITIVARGGEGGTGGRGGDGGYGAFPEGAGGPGGNGGVGGDGGPGGSVMAYVDDRFPELGDKVKIDVSGGLAGYGGDGGYGGPGGDPAEVCSECTPHDPGPEGPGGLGGAGGQYDGAAGQWKADFADVTAAFGELPRGVELRDDPREVVAPPPRPTPHKSRRSKRRR